MFLRPAKSPTAVLVVLVATAGLAAAEPIPVPRPRPAQAPTAGMPSPAVQPLPQPAPLAPGETVEGPPLPSTPSDCQVRLARDLAVIAPQPPLSEGEACGAIEVVRLDAILTPDRRRIDVVPPATLHCRMATAVAHWVRDALAPATAKLGAPLAAIANFASYECRGRNRIFGAKLSEHGKGNALDVRAFRLADGKAFSIVDTAIAKDLREALKSATCARFATVLGPGSDGFHEDHIHVDLAERRGDYRMCQWELREPVAVIPVPRPRPPEAPPRAAEEETPAE